MEQHCLVHDENLMLSLMFIFIAASSTLYSVILVCFCTMGISWITWLDFCLLIILKETLYLLYTELSMVGSLEQLNKAFYVLHIHLIRN